MQTSEQIAPLLARISAIVFKYETIAEITGERFNVFSILNLERREVLTHSRFLAEILNPKGSHGLGSLPLQKFFEVIGIREFPVENAQVKCETNIGLINDQKTEGGRIDILIKSRDQKAMVAIENKIDAVDQENQLLRYYNYLKNHSADHRLLYLTLEGSGASAHSTGTSQTIPHAAISYAAEILVWLAAIHKEAANKPIIRESILQYMNLIRKLTHQTENEKMARELAEELAKDNEQLKSFFSIYDSRDAVFRSVAEKNKRAWQAIARTRGLEADLKLHVGKGAGIWFSNAALKNRNLDIGFEFEKEEMGKLYYGFYDGEKLPMQDRLKIKQEFERQFGGHVGQAGSWPAFQYWSEYEVGRDLLLKLNSAEADEFNRALAEKLDLLLNVSHVLN